MLDKKWDGTKVENLHLIAIIRQENILSLRDLKREHIELLENLRKKSFVSISPAFLEAFSIAFILEDVSLAMLFNKQWYT